MRKKIINTLFIIGFIFYTLFILWNILFKYVSPLEIFSNDRFFSQTLNIIPFNDVFKGNFNKMDIYGNVILFIPFGIYINMIIKDAKLSKSICIIAVISFIFEVIQYILGIGASDITDIITNTIGGIIGIGIYIIIKSIFKSDNKVKSFITICSTIIMLIVSIILIGIFIYN